MEGDQLAAVAGADPAQHQLGVGPDLPGGRARLPAVGGRAERVTGRAPDLSRPMTTARSPLERDSATCSASCRQTLTRK
jgi:hypothetical protein